MSIEAATRPPGGAAPKTDIHRLLGELHAEQGRLQTPAALFAHSGLHSSAAHTAGGRHSDLIPLSAPAPGEQYAFQVDLDACSGCKACVAGCHSLNGLDEDETWRNVGLIVGGATSEPYQQTVTTACHHCEDPACLNGCPVLAYEKDPLTGIVKHLDDQCIGCSYCVLKCPYDVPKFSSRLGIVRKCDMCHGRLAAGEAPACVQACPTQAISIIKVARTTHLPDAPSADSGALSSVWPDPAITRPTTRYVTRRELPSDVRAADASDLRVQPAHTPLVGMLVLTQASVGALLAHLVLNSAGALLFAGATGLAGIAASVAHLGRPLRAWRVFLGLRRSWLSREAALFGLYLPLLLLAVLGAAAGKPTAPATWLAAVVGLAAVGASIMIYVDTRRSFWGAWPSALRMFGTVAIIALALCFPPLAAVALAGKLLAEAASLRGSSPSARLQRGRLRTWVGIRFLLGGAAVALLAAALPTPLAIASVLLGEAVERLLYFRAVDAPRMPGLPA